MGYFKEVLKIIELNNVSFSYQNRENESIRNINLKINDGECVLFCGRSGCGKTSVTRLINGLIPNFYKGNLEGEVILDNENISNMPMYKIAEKVGSVFQNPRTQFFNVDTDSEIAFGIENKAIPEDELKTIVDKTIEELNIENLRNRNIFELSGGEKQKVAFASVYSMNPNVYLLDEPSSNLDMSAIDELKRHISLIKEQGKTVVITEHRIYYLMEIVDKIVYLDDGEIKGVYTPDEFKKLSDMERKEKGLRAIDLNSETPVLNEKTDKPYLLELKDISVSYKEKHVFENINIKASKGDIIAVSGHNGEGKTTFSRTICGLHKNSEGSFLWNDKIQNHKSRLKLSYMVMQDVNYELFAESVESECSFGIKNPDKELVEKTMETLGILKFRDRHPNTLSGGQKQRVAVAISMIGNREILIFDEPTSGLDYDSMTQVASLIKKLSDMGKVIFIVTHDYEFIMRTCSRLINIDKGKITDDLYIDNENISRIKELFEIQIKDKSDKRGLKNKYE